LRQQFTIGSSKEPLPFAIAAQTAPAAKPARP